MIKTEEIFSTMFFKIFAIPIWGGYLLIAADSEKDATTFFLPEKAVEVLSKMHLARKEAP